MTLSFPSLPGLTFGPGFMPQLVLAIMFAGGVVLLLRKKGPDEATEEPVLALERHNLVFFAVVVGGLLLYSFALDRIGFLPLTIVFTAVVVRLSGGSTLGSIAFAVDCTLAMQWAFGTLLRVPLPAGFLGY
jgi:putative tricarboxylic transport membrane protein